MRLPHVSIVFACPLFICVCVSYKTRHRRGLFLLNRSACGGFAVCPARRHMRGRLCLLVALVFQPSVSNVHEYQLLNLRGAFLGCVSLARHSPKMPRVFLCSRVFDLFPAHGFFFDV